MDALADDEHADELGRAYFEGRAATQAVLHFARRGWRYGLRISSAATVADETDRRMAAAMCLLECAGGSVRSDDQPTVRLLLLQATVLARDVDALLENAAL